MTSLVIILLGKLHLLLSHVIIQHIILHHLYQVTLTVTLQRQSNCHCIWGKQKHKMSVYAVL